MTKTLSPLPRQGESLASLERLRAVGLASPSIALGDFVAE